MSEVSTYRRKPLRIAVVLVLGIIVVGFTVYRYRHRSLPFDEVAWKNAKTDDELDRRFRMMPAIESMIQTGRLRKREDFIAKLGKPNRDHPLNLVYCLGPEHRSFIRIDSDWLDLRFDDNGNLIQHLIRPD
jgi:hypothetical protein